MQRLALSAGLFVLVAGCTPPTEADRAELIGLWQPEDGSGRTVEFKADGVFDYRYAKGTTLRLDWTLDRRGKVSLVSGNGVTKVCHYTVTGKSLSIDDGSNGECVSPGVTPPSPMPRRFTRG